MNIQMITFNKITADIDDGKGVINQAIELIKHNRNIVFIIDNCISRSNLLINKLGKDNCILITSSDSIQERHEKMTKWISGSVSFILVKKTYYTCDVVHTAIIENAHAIIQIRNISTPNEFIKLLNEWDSTNKKNILECIYSLRDFDFSYDKIKQQTSITKTVNTINHLERKKKCKRCNNHNSLLAKTCQSCGNDLIHESYLDITKLRLGILQNDFNPCNGDKLRLLPLHGIDYPIRLIKKINQHQADNNMHSLLRRKYNFIHTPNINNTNPDVVNYPREVLVCYIQDKNSNLTFLSLIPSDICNEFIMAINNNNLNQSIASNLPGLLANLKFNELSKTRNANGYCYEFSETDKVFIKKKILGIELFALIQANAKYDIVFGKKFTSNSSLYANQLFNLLINIDNNQITEIDFLSYADQFINQLGHDLNWF